MKCEWCNNIIKGNVYLGFDKSFCRSNHRTDYMHKHWSLLQNYPFPYSHDLEFCPIIDEELGLKVISEEEELDISKDYVCINVKSQLCKRRNMIETVTHADEIDDKKKENICQYITNCLKVKSWHCVNIFSQYLNKFLINNILEKEKVIL